MVSWHQLQLIEFITVQLSTIQWMISAFKADLITAGRTLCVEPVGRVDKAWILGSR